MQNEALFRDKPVWNAILTMAGPAVFNILITILYNMVDMFFIGQLGDTAKVGAISVVSPVFSVLSAISTMIGAGGCAAIAKPLAAGKPTMRAVWRHCANGPSYYSARCLA